MPSIYIVRGGHRTTVSVDQQLLAYLCRRIDGKLPAKRVMAARAGDGDSFFEQAHAEYAAARSLKRARLWIQSLVDAVGDELPPSGLSQWVQARIIDAIADPSLKDAAVKQQEEFLDARRAELHAQRMSEWRAHEDDRKRKVEMRDRVLGSLPTVPKSKRFPPDFVA